MISADSMMPEAFRRMFEVQKMKAGLFLPIDVSGKTGMYVCFCEDEKERIWDGGETSLSMMSEESYRRFW